MQSFKAIIAAAGIAAAPVTAAAQNHEQCVALSGVAMNIAELRQAGVPMYAVNDRIEQAQGMADEEKLALMQLVVVVYMMGVSPSQTGRVVYSTCMEGAA